ncbi:hypothetical protein EVAR_17077_1 [Eumeta japonica]|uniref:THAP-type domain-containing protein n=1 Tax=Eumeta variegata TaxID=151549 RepID=A0A4C1V583_EUMVA|nr:hypothetical protein EVAR_17077_1 [Eumeta japonica]
MPNDIEMRTVRLELARRDPKSFSTKSDLYLCEDHFNRTICRVSDRRLLKQVGITKLIKCSVSGPAAARAARAVATHPPIMAPGACDSYFIVIPLAVRHENNMTRNLLSARSGR